jgi:hypothetical protein
MSLNLCHSQFWQRDTNINNPICVSSLANAIGVKRLCHEKFHYIIILFYLKIPRIISKHFCFA